MQPKHTLRLLLLLIYIPIAVGIPVLAATGRQPNKIPGWFIACTIVYFASLFIYTNVYIRLHRDELRDTEALERLEQWAVKHRPGILNTLLVSSIAGIIIPLLLFSLGHRNPLNRFIIGYWFVVSVITLVLCVRSKLRGFSDRGQASDLVGKDPRIP